MISWPLRIAGWIIGIYAMLKLAAATGTVTYTTVFQAWMDQLRDFLDLGFILKPLTQAVILPALDLIRSFDIPIPPLQDHWQQLFVLMWLLTAAHARNMSLGVSTPVALLAAFVGNLPFCVAAGTMPVDSYAANLWPLASILALFAVIELLKKKVPFTLPFAIIIALFAAGGTGGAGRNAVAQLAICVGVVGLAKLMKVFDGEGTFSQRLQHPDAATGLDITAAMLGAFGLATAFADPPLF